MAYAYRVQVVDLDGGNVEELPRVDVGDITDALNEAVTAEISWPKHAYTYEQIPVLGTEAGTREVQIYRVGESDPIVWGPLIAVKGAGSDGRIRGTVANCDWLLRKRTISGLRDNLVSNPSFELGLDGWTETVSFLGGDITAEVTTDWKVLGESSVRLTSSTAQGDQYFEQTFEVEGGAIGELLTIVGWFLLESIAADGHALGRRGLFMQGTNGDGHVAYDWYPIDDATPIGQEIRAEFELLVPPGETWDISLRLYAPSGSVMWDAINVVKMESLSTAAEGGSVNGQIDIADIVELLVFHVQNPLENWSDLLINVLAPDTGQTAAKHYQYADFVPFDEALMEWIDRDDVGDYYMTFTPIVKLFNLVTPRRGVDRSSGEEEVILQLGPGGNLADYDWAPDGAGCITWATVMGEGDGPDREEGNYTDASAVGGLIINEVRQAPQRSKIYSLEPQARDIVAQRGRPPLNLNLLVKDRALIALLGTGDFVNVEIDDGYVQVHGRCRITQRVLHGDNNTMSVTIQDYQPVAGSGS